MSEVSAHWHDWTYDGRGWYLINDPEVVFYSEEEAMAYCDEHNRALIGQALRQLDSERGMNAFLTGEVEGLRSRLGAEATDERAKIVAHIVQVADRIKNDPDGIAWGHLQAMAIVIEAGEHLK